MPRSFPTPRNPSDLIYKEQLGVKELGVKELGE
jgi:hypothetical protein